jgi:predicted anti-sigma-YlaC factor YlaD
MTREPGITCREIVELTTEFLEGTLAPDVGRRFVDHLAQCPGCENYLEQVRETIRLTGMISEDAIEPHQRERLVAAFRDWNDAR